MSRSLGIDFGFRRVGLALSDPERIIAQPFRTIEWSEIDGLVMEIVRLVDEYKIGAIAIGSPLHLSGDKSEMSIAVDAFANILKNRLDDVDIVLIDERLTSKQAERIIRECGERPGRDKGKTDAVAASIILEAYLEKDNLNERIQ